MPARSRGRRAADRKCPPLASAVAPPLSKVTRKLRVTPVPIKAKTHAMTSRASIPARGRGAQPWLRLSRWCRPVRPGPGRSRQRPLRPYPRSDAAPPRPALQGPGSKRPIGAARGCDPISPPRRTPPRLSTAGAGITTTRPPRTRPTTERTHGAGADHRSQPGHRT
jgi:hypothetical protein